MRIVYLHQYFNTPQMQGSTRSYEMARRLVARGHVVEMVTSRRDVPTRTGRTWETTTEAGIRVHWLPVRYSNSMEYKDRIEAFLRFAWAAAAKASRLAADVVFATSTPLTIALPAAYAARRRRLPMVFEVRDLWPELPIAMGALRNPVVIGTARWLERFAYRHSAQIVALSPSMKAGVVATGYPDKQVTVIPNACDVEMFQVGPEPGLHVRRSHEWLGERPLVLYAGTIGRINGLEYFVRLASHMAHINPQVRFAIVGEGMQQQTIRSLAAREGLLERNLFMIGSVPKAQVPAWMSAATLTTSLFIDLPAMRANSANKVFDSLAAGKPVAINYDGWQADLVRETGAGLVLDAHDVAAAAAALSAALGDSGWLTGASHAAYRLAQERFARDELALQLESVLCTAVQSHNTHRDGRVAAAVRSSL